MSHDAPKETHPAYGRIKISRVTGGGSKKRPLFASSIFHGETIRISVSRASLRRDNNTDWIFDEGDALIEIEMSPVQFAELLTSTGPGTPCTILRVAGEQMPPVEYKNKKEEARDEFKAQVVEITKCMKDMDEALDELKSAKTIKKSDIERISNLFGKVRQDIASNMPFAAECFDEQMERSILEAKGEIEAYMLHKALRMAQEGMNLVKQLDEPEAMPQLQLEEEKP